MQSNLLLTHLFNSIKEKPFYFVYLPLIVYWIFLFIMTSIPVESIPKYFDTQDKLEHFIAYFILSIFLSLSLSLQNKSVFFKSNALMISAITVFFYASIDEIHQIFIPGRYCDFYDWLFDIAGGLTGILFISSIIKKYNLVPKK